LVTEVDGRPVVKVIDFGLAKALHGSQVLTDLSMHTAFGAVLGTPLYMAPEQLGTSALDVDTRADLYSLGVILYELLTGTTPIERQQLKASGL
jgi:eukaryotic-like serine/threonine-protein kinase